MLLIMGTDFLHTVEPHLAVTFKSFARKGMILNIFPFNYLIITLKLRTIVT